MARRVLLTDLDNTWFNWVDFFGCALRAMVHALANALCADEDELYAQLRAIYQTYGTLEYKFAIQSLPLFQQADRASRERALRAAVVAFSGARNRRLAMYEGAREALRWLAEQEVLIVAVTNSPVFETLGRLHTLGITRHFGGLVAWRGPDPVANLLADRIAETRIGWVLPLEATALKPNPAAYASALAALGPAVVRDSVWVLGDSLNKDLQPATALGAVTIWARYGRDFNQRNFDTLLRVTHWSEERIQSTYVCDAFKPDHTIDSLKELRRIIPPRQPALF